MIEFHAAIRQLHVGAVIASGGLFFLRGLAVRAGRGRWALRPAVRYASIGIDTVLLTAALALVTTLPPAVFANGWLAAKLALLPVYVGLGWLSLRRPGTGAGPVALFAGALAAFVLMAWIARTHDPLGPLRAWAVG